MTLIVPVDRLHNPVGPITALPRGRRRRLSTIAKQHAPRDRATVALVFRAGEDWRTTNKAALDRAARLRSQYRSTLVGPDDIVLFVRPAMGGKSGLAIALSVAAIALLIAAPWAGAAIGGFAGFLVQGGMVIGAALLRMAAGKANAAKKGANGEFYDIAPSGNTAKRGARRPLIYGKCWTTPPLSQRDYIRYIGNKQTVLVKRMTLGLGKFDLLAIRVGESTFWTKAGGVQSPFSVSSLFGISSTVEVLYGQASTIVPGDVATSESVVGQELPRPLGNPDWTPWYRLTPNGVKAKKAYLAWSFGPVMIRGGNGESKPNNCGIAFRYQKLDPVTGNPTGPIYLDDSNRSYVYLPDGGHFGIEKEFPEAAEWQVQASNLWPEASVIGAEASNSVYWDEMSALLADVRVREGTTEVVIRVSGIKGISSLGDVQVQAERILPVWTGTTWVEEPTSKCVWAFADLIRSEYGLNRPDGVDKDRCFALASRGDLDGYDTFSGQLENVTSFGVALNTVLAPLRAQQQRVGGVYTIVRDESAEEAGGRHVITARQIITDSSAQRFIFSKTDAANGDIIVEFERDGDPRRPDEARQTVFAETRTPKRYKMAGVTGGAHAVQIANWLAAIDRYRGAERTITVEWEGRLIYPGTHLLAPLWFVQAQAAVSARLSSGNVLVLGERPNLAPGSTYASLRDKRGREWGILRATYDGGDLLTLNSTDVATRQAATGMLLADVMTDELLEPNTLVLGDLVEVQETYIARSVRPVDEDHVEIEMVLDNPQVWTAIGETPVIPGPVTPEGPEDILRPDLPSVRAYCQRTETDIQLVWSVPQPLGAVTFDVQYAIDDEEDGPADDWQDIQTGLASASGSVPVRQSPLPIRVRARANGRTGLPGAWVQTTFTTVPPRIDGSNTQIVDITLEQVNAYFRGLIEGTGPGSIGAAFNTANAANALAQSVFGSMADMRLALSADPADRARSKQVARALRDDLDLITAAIADAQSRIELMSGIMVQIGVVQTEGAYKIAGEAVLEGQINTVALNLDALKGRVELLATTIIDGDLDGLLDTLNQLSITMDSVQAELSLRVTSAQLGTVNDRITTLDTTMNGPAGTVTTLASAVGTLTGQVSSAMLQVSALGQIVATTNATQIKLDGDLRDATLEALLARVAELEGTTSAAISSTSVTFGSRIGEMGEAIAESSKVLVTAQGQTAARFSALEQVVSDGFTATAKAQSTLETATKNAAGRIGTLEQVTTSSDATSHASRLTQIETEIDGDGSPGNPGLSGRLTSLETVVAYPETGLVEQLDDLQVSIFGAGPGDTTSLNARLTAVATVLGTVGPPATGLVSDVRSLLLTVNGDGTPGNPSIAAQISTVSTVANNAATAAGTAQTTANNAQSAASAAAGTATTALARANDMTASGTLQFLVTAAPSGAVAAYTIALKAGNITAGLSVLAMSNGTSQIRIDAGQIVSGTLAADGVNRRMVIDMNVGSISMWR